MGNKFNEIVHSKLFAIILVGILMLTTVLVGTYAWFTWSSTEDTVFNMTIGEIANVTFEGGNAITGNLDPVFNYSDGLSTSFSIDNKNSSDESVFYNINFNITSIDPALSSNASDIRYTILKGGKVLKEGNLSGANNNTSITLYSGKLDSGITEYVVYLYINGNVENDISMMGKILTGNIVVVEGTGDGIKLIEHIKSLYTSGAPTVGTNTEISTYYQSYQDDKQTWGLMNDGYEGVNKVTDVTALTSGTKGNIRYFGKKSNNYIYFNCDDYSNQSSSTCELWRIIGIVDGKVKIIKNDIIGKLAWDAPNNEGADATNVNNWQNSSLQKFLNGKYYDRGTTTNFTYYSGSSGTIEASLNLENLGITTVTREANLISESTWYLGGYTSTNLYADDIYVYERTNNEGTTIASGNPFKLENTNIGLMYASDYSYGADLNKCSDDLQDYNNCSGTNYLSTSAFYQWLITPRYASSSSKNVWNVGLTGYISPSYFAVESDKVGVRPVLYLDNELVIEEGNGSEGNPYKLYVEEESLVEHLTNKYLSANPAKATTANNGIYYYYAPSVNMMNDGMGSNHTWEDGANTGNIRYYGATPANYIDIGDRDASGNVIPWRIIGVFKNMTLADGSTDTLVKVIRDQPLSSDMQWDDDSNDWHNATLQTYLNTGEYYTELPQDVKDKIAKVEWNLGGWDSATVYSNLIYEKERGSYKCSSCTYETIWEGDIALMYPSDYGYASDLAKCSKDLNHYSDDTTNCTGTDWLFNSEKSQWLLTPTPFFVDYVWNARSLGFVVSVYSVNSSYGVRPVLYLKSELGIESGDGTTVASAYVVR